VPLRCLLSDSFAAQRRSLITDRAVNAPVAAGDCGGANTARIDREGPSTTHLTVADKRGFVVSYTFTIESTGGNGIVVPGYGFLLNNELTDFNFGELDHPNSAAGNKRPRSSMAPTIVTRHGRPVLAVGSPGGSMIITTVLQVLTERLELGSSLPQAVAAPRASQRNGDTSIAEPAFMQTEAPALTTRHGHAFGTPQNEIGAVTGIELLGRDRFLAAAEPTRRGGGSAAVVRKGR
jgi:gamma-glutamyltranspeptidase/glutathione hydrolase